MIPQFPFRVATSTTSARTPCGGFTPCPAAGLSPIWHRVSQAARIIAHPAVWQPLAACLALAAPAVTAALLLAGIAEGPRP